jgi:hypothetical protein
MWPLRTHAGRRFQLPAAGTCRSVGRRPLATSSACNVPQTLTGRAASKSLTLNLKVLCIASGGQSV